MAGKRANGEGSIFPYKGKWAGYVWVATPGGERKRAWVYGDTREEVPEGWLKLHTAAQRGPVVTKAQTIADYLSYWLSDIIKPNREDSTYAHYEVMSRLYVIPGIGNKRIDKLTLRETQTWLNKIPNVPVLRSE